MHLLNRSSTRLVFKRIPAGFTWLPLYFLHDRPHLDRDPASIKRLFVLFKDRLHYQGCPVLPSREAIFHYRNSWQEPLENPPSEIAEKESFSVGDSGTLPTRSYKGKEEHDIELDVGSKFLKPRCFRIDPCKAFLEIAKRDFHNLPEKEPLIDPGMSSAIMNERRLTHSDGEVEVDAKEMPRNNSGDMSEKQSLHTSANMENLEEGLHRDDKEAVTLQFASKLCVNGSTGLLDAKDMEGKTNGVISLHHGDFALRSAASSSKKKGHAPRPCERSYFSVLAKKKKNKRKKKTIKSWEAERQLKLKYVSPASLPNHIAIAEIGSDKVTMHGQATLPKHVMLMPKIIKPMGQQEFSGQEVRKQANCVEQSGTHNASQDSVLEEELIASNSIKNEKGDLKLKEVSKDLGANCKAFLMQEASKGMEPNLHQGRHSFELIRKGGGVCNKDDTSSCYQNREELFVYDDLKATTASNFYPKGWMTAHIETLRKGVDGDVYHHAGPSKVHFPLGNLNMNHLYVIFDLNGVLIKRWDVNPSLPGVSKLNKRWIQFRPGCIEFLCKAFSKFKVGIWSTMTHKNVTGVCNLLEQEAHQSLPFFMLWSKDSCYQQRGVCRPNKPRVLADFKPLSHVWRFFEPYLGFHNTVLIDDSPYKACMNNPYSCIFPDTYEGCTEDNYLTDVLWPYLEKMRLSQNVQAYIANNPLGQQPIVVGHKLYYHVQQVMDDCNYHNHPSGKGELSGKV
ncbi:hypothetical protein L7F22_044680 [Adiantum nelumboides]|nr:hypothetical protein [Adiantum nelumboides]